MPTLFRFVTYVLISWRQGESIKSCGTGEVNGLLKYTLAGDINDGDDGGLKTGDWAPLHDDKGLELGDWAPLHDDKGLELGDWAPLHDDKGLFRDSLPGDGLNDNLRLSGGLLLIVGLRASDGLMLNDEE